MTSELVYRCHNMGGPDGDCEYAATGELIAASAVTFNDNDEPICPGETVFGDPCGCVLEAVTPAKKKPWAAIAGALVVIPLLVGVAWFFFLRGDAVLRVEQDVFALSPGETVKVEVFNDGEVSLNLSEIVFSARDFSTEQFESGLEVAPGSSAFFRVKFANSAQDSIQGTMTLFSNSVGEPVSIELIGNANPWSVTEKLNSASTILDKE
ncbi:hypothetical protein [Vibrio sp. WXL103]|uniref:hypothetical protein n=1 Tax=Vibrio sp. WXL103 TaxID=3450710 RepID=UPI003EC7C710